MKKLSIIIAVLILAFVCSCTETNKQKTDLDRAGSSLFFR